MNLKKKKTKNRHNPTKESNKPQISPLFNSIKYQRLNITCEIQSNQLTQNIPTLTSFSCLIQIKLQNHINPVQQINRIFPSNYICKPYETYPIQIRLPNLKPTTENRRKDQKTRQFKVNLTISNLNKTPIE